MMDVKEGLFKEEEKLKESLQVMLGTDEPGVINGSFIADQSKSKLSFTDDDIVSNCLQLFIGGFDAIQSALIFATYQLSLDEKIQDKILEEVGRTFAAEGGKLTYEGLLQMKYLDMFVNEILRYYSPATRTERTCSKNYTIPGTNVVIEKGVVVALPVLPLHRDSKYYENPEKFDPDRFLPENKSQRHPYAFAPWGHGPRNCIGMRFALIEIKTMIASLVYHFKMEPCGRTEVPFKIENHILLKPANGMWLNLTPRDGSQRKEK